MATIVIPLAADLPFVLFALRRESMYFRRAHRPLRPLNTAPCYAAVAADAPHSFLLVETGVGRRAVTAAIDWLFTAVPHPRFVVYAGFAGALDADLHVGDVLLADAVTDSLGVCWPCGFAVADCAGVQRGRLFTADRLISAPDEKRKLALLHGARMVDMEAAHVAERCARSAAPFFCVRAISDTQDTRLSPTLVQLLAGERVSTVRVIRALCRTPALLPELYRLGRDTRVAARHLARALNVVLPRGGHRGSRAANWVV